MEEIKEEEKSKTEELKPTKTKAEIGKEIEELEKRT